MKKESATPSPRTPGRTTATKSACITLRAGGNVMTLNAVLMADGTALTFVTTRGADKKAERGMSSTEPSMAAARTRLLALLSDAEKLGWKRGVRATAKADAFTKLPAAPKVVA